MTTFDILIVGRGFVAHAQAIALANAMGDAYRIGLLEVDSRQSNIALASARNSNPRSPRSFKNVGGRAFAISAASQRMLAALGVWPSLSEYAEPVRSILLTDSSLDAGLRRKVLTYENALADGTPASYILPADLLAAELKERTHTIASVEVLSGPPPEYISHSAPHVELTFNGGKTISASLIVAADGRNSALRDLAGIKVVKQSADQVGLVCQISHTRAHNGTATQHFLPGGPFAILPLPDQRACVTWSEHKTTAERILALDDDAFLDEVAVRVGGFLGELELVGPRQHWSIETHMARAFIAPRLALVGDAVRAVHPIAGQGLNLGFRDVAALTQVISEAGEVGLDLGNGQTLDRYQRWRRFESVVSSGVFSGLNDLFSNDIDLLRSVRSAGLQILNRFPMVKQNLVKQAAGLAGDVPKLMRDELR